jgi:hypothetical protein
VTDQAGPGGSSQWASPGGYQQPPPPVEQYAPAQPVSYSAAPYGSPVAAPPPGPPGYGPAGYGPVPVPGPPSRPLPGQVRVDPVPGTEFGVAYLPVPPTSSGLAIGSLVAGIGSVAVALVVGCFGLAGGEAGWGAIVSGAFAVLGGLLGLGSVGIGLVSMRQIKAANGRLTGRGIAIAGISCGGAGVLLTAGGMLLALVALAA